jgi:ComF family protein
MKFVNHFFDFFLPRFCTACGEKLYAEEKFICGKCFAKIKTTDEQFILNEFNRKFLKDKIISDFHPYFIFEKDKEFQSVIHSVKYNENFRLGIFIGVKIGKGLNEKINLWSPDFILPVPLHHLKKAERGFNQSFYIAKGISKISGVPVKNNIIKRGRFTPSQTQFNKHERKENMRGAFVLKRNNNLHGKKIILVDDVITTGATITECGKILLDAGAEKVFAISAAIADL